MDCVILDSEVQSPVSLLTSHLPEQFLRWVCYKTEKSFAVLYFFYNACCGLNVRCSPGLFVSILVPPAFEKAMETLEGSALVEEMKQVTRRWVLNHPMLLGYRYNVTAPPTNSC